MGIEEKLPSGFLLTTVETAAGWVLMAGALALMVTSTIVLSRMPVK